MSTYARIQIIDAQQRKALASHCNPVRGSVRSHLFFNSDCKIRRTCESRVQHSQVSTTQRKACRLTTVAGTKTTQRHWHDVHDNTTTGLDDSAQTTETHPNAHTRTPADGPRSCPDFLLQFSACNERHRFRTRPTLPRAGGHRTHQRGWYTNVSHPRDP